jgi:formylglycine-generating enzyme required for sulfatase activity
LERICLKALAKRVTERYPTARDLADDLRHFLEKGTPSPSGSADEAGSAPVSPASSSASRVNPRPIKVVPKGLRAFDAGDADFFLELLPGPRDRDGLPDSLRFWKTRIEEADSDRTFPVALIYGPSGCGKSSLIKAGLLPRLADQVRAVYIEATPEATEGRLLNGLRKRCPDLPSDLGLVDALAALRRGRGIPPGEKVLLVIDQFEQWLHAHPGDDNLELVQALRQCDGGQVQAVVLVRDDFGMAATRFMHALEVPIVDAHNFATVDLFDARHARKVLAEFGRAFGALPDDLGAFTREQDRFLDQAVARLAQDGKVVPVRLALFAEMVRAKPWTAATLKAVGGAEGIGITFLEETFGHRVANPEHRRHRQAARAVLKALLPEQGADIKGHMRTEQELLQASGYAHRPAEFPAVLHILDSELRLVTPTDPAGLVEEDGQSEPGSNSGRFYQLTHDFLVPALRDWLTQKQRETRRGRAELRLATRAALWCAAPEKRHLPSWREWVGIRLWTHRRNWSPAQRRMMRAADRHHLLHSWTRLFVLVLIGWASFEAIGYLSAFFVINAFRTSMANQEQIIRDLYPFRRWAKPMLKDTIGDDSPDAEAFAKCAGILLKLYPEETDYVCSRFVKASYSNYKPLRKALQPYHSLISEVLWKKLEDPQSPTEERSRAAFFLFPRERTNPRWSRVGYRERYEVVRALVGVVPSEDFTPDELKNIPLWPHPYSGKDPLVSSAFVESLAAIVYDRHQYTEVRNRAMALLVPFNLAQPEVAARLWTVVNNPAMEMRQRCQAAIALMLAYDTADPRWNALSQDVRNEVAAILAETNTNWLSSVPLLNPVVIKPLVDIARDDKRPQDHRIGALRLLSQFHDAPFLKDRTPFKLLVDIIRDNKVIESYRIGASKLLGQFQDIPCELFAEVVLTGTSDDRNLYYPEFWLSRLLPHQKEATQLMERELKRKAVPGASEQVREALANRQANAALALLWFGKPEPMLSLLQPNPDPQVRTDLIQGKIPHWFAHNRLPQEKSESIKRALILCLAQRWADMISFHALFSWDQLGLYRNQSSFFLAHASLDLTSHLVQLYRDDPDPGIHSAVDFLFSQLRENGPPMRGIDHTLLSERAVNGRRWYINRAGHTLAVVPGSVEFLMGSPVNEPGRNDNETLHRCRIPRAFAIATKEVTVQQFQRFLQANPGIHHPFPEKDHPDANHPVTSLTWFEAAQYCRWLSEQEGILEDQMCYPPVPQIREGMQLPADYLERTGYRLPTEAEWEFACRAGSVTKRAYGSSDQLLGKYAWYAKGPPRPKDGPPPVHKVGELMPNDLGMFDMYGNAGEWCQDRLLPYPQGKGPIPEDREDTILVIIDDQLRVLRGGSAASPASELRSAFRTGARPSQAVPLAGLRVARSYR